MRVLKVCVGAALGLVLLAGGCSDSNVHTDDDDDCDDPPPIVCDGFQEMEPNDELLDYNFVGILPDFTPPPICARFDPLDLDSGADVFYFVLQPENDAPTIITNWVLTTAEDVLPYLEFYQSQFDDNGDVTEITLIGTFYGEDGYIEVLDYNVSYQFLSKRDLYVRVGGISALPLETYPYEISYWTHQ